MKNDPSREWAFKITVISGLFVIGLFSFLLIRNEPFRDSNLAIVARSLLAFGVAACGAAIPGTLKVEWLKGIVIRSSGAMALFVLTLVFTPKVFPVLDTTRAELVGEQMKSMKTNCDTFIAELKGRIAHTRDEKTMKQMVVKLDQFRTAWKQASDEYTGGNGQQSGPSLEDQENALRKMENILRDMETFARSIPEKPLNMPVASQPEQSSNIVDVIPAATNSTVLNNDLVTKPAPPQAIPAPLPATNANALSPPTEIAKINDGFKPGAPPVSDPSSSAGTNSSVTTTNGGTSTTQTNRIHRPSPPGAPHVVP